MANEIPALSHAVAARSTARAARPIYRGCSRCPRGALNLAEPGVRGLDSEVQAATLDEALTHGVQWRELIAVAPEYGRP